MISTIVVVVDHGTAGRIIEDFEDGIFPASVHLRAIILDGEVMRDDECILLLLKRISCLRKLYHGNHNSPAYRYSRKSEPCLVSRYFLRREVILRRVGGMEGIRIVGLGCGRWRIRSMGCETATGRSNTLSHDRSSPLEPRIFMIGGGPFQKVNSPFHSITIPFGTADSEAMDGMETTDLSWECL